jgi:hypothetical protein
MTLRFASKNNSTATTLEGLEEFLAKPPKTIAQSEWEKLSPIDKIKCTSVLLLKVAEFKGVQAG